MVRAEIMLRSVTVSCRFITIRNVSGFYCTEGSNVFNKPRFCSSSAAENVTDPAPVFLNEKVQTLLKSLTRPDPKKVFRKRMDGRKLTPPEYKFMTDKQLARTFEIANERMAKFLQMPPVVKPQQDKVEILSEDPEIRQPDVPKYVFTDITHALKDKDRLIVVREPDGTLRKANNDERKRMLQAYFPVKGREMKAPKMFHGEYFEDLLNQQEYEFILNKATVQYEPNETEWLRVTHAVYDHINNTKAYNKLLSTRFYGPMVFYYTWNKEIDNLLLENLREHKFEDAVWLVQLYQQIHPDCQSAKMENDGDELDFIMQYVKTDAKNKSRLEVAVNTCKEWKEAQAKLEENVKRAHGIE